ncbi:MAG: dienelactone hydrolase family protein [Gammaproteobacteria bacterium]|nr:dienelactone hydrolase family protein [Gammaproteobacteria bacterium]
MTIQTKTIEYVDAGDTLEAFVAWDDSIAGKRPGVMVAHAWAGRTSFENDVATKLAGLGYVGFALDCYGKGVQGNSPEENTALMQPFLADRAMLQARLHTSLTMMREVDMVDAHRVAATGYCFGGLCVLDLARTGADVKGCVSFHGLFNSPGNTDGNTITAKVLALHGWNDPLAPPADVVAFGEEMTEANVDWQLIGYGGTLHAFTDPQANRPDLGGLYNADADRRSWIAMENFLGEVLA